MSHTPGPWNNNTADETAVVDEHGIDVAQMVGDYNKHYERMSANARLIAASPTMYDLLSLIAAGLVPEDKAREAAKALCAKITSTERSAS